MFFPNEKWDHDKYHDAPSFNIVNLMKDNECVYKIVTCETPRGYEIRSDEYGYPVIYKNGNFVSNLYVSYKNEICFIKERAEGKVTDEISIYSPSDNDTF